VSGNNEPRLAAERTPDVFDDQLVGRVGNRDDGHAVLERERERILDPSDALGQELPGRSVDLNGRYIEVRKPLLTSEEPAEVGVANQATLGENLAQALSGAHAFLERVFELFLRQEACAEDQCPERDVAHPVAARRVSRLERSNRRLRRDRRD
jgi:hypothetical protein